MNQRSIFDRFFCLRARLTDSHSRFDKFNHVKYTKTLSVRNRRATNRLLFLRRTRPTHIRAAPSRDFFAPIGTRFGPRRGAREERAAHLLSHRSRHAPARFSAPLRSPINALVGAAIAVEKNGRCDMRSVFQIHAAARRGKRCELLFRRRKRGGDGGDTRAPDAPASAIGRGQKFAMH